MARGKSEPKKFKEGKEEETNEIKGMRQTLAFAREARKPAKKKNPKLSINHPSFKKPKTFNTQSKRIIAKDPLDDDETKNMNMDNEHDDPETRKTRYKLGKLDYDLHELKQRSEVKTPRKANIASTQKGKTKKANKTMKRMANKKPKGVKRQ
jgi:hypothetical protein